MRSWIIIYLFVTCHSLQEKRKNWLRPYFVSDDLKEYASEESTTLTQSRYSEDTTTAVMLPSTVTKTSRERRFGAWESDMRFPQTIEKVVKTLTDPFNLLNAVSVLPEALVMPFFMILILLTGVWNFSLLIFITVLAFKIMRLIFFVFGKLAVCSIGCVSKSCCRRLATWLAPALPPSDTRLQVI